MAIATKNITNVTGTRWLAYVLWGERPEDSEYVTYGFETEREQVAFLKGLEEAEGWLGYLAGWGHKTDAKALEDFEKDIQQTYDYLSEESSYA